MCHVSAVKTITSGERGHLAQYDSFFSRHWFKAHFFPLYYKTCSDGPQMSGGDNKQMLSYADPYGPILELQLTI